METLRIGGALAQLAQTISDQPEKARARHGWATATVENGLTCRIAGPSGEMVRSDMPRAMGGDGTNPNPGWLFRASLASCLATVIAMRAAQVGVVLSSLEVTVESEGDHRGILGLDDRVSAGALSLCTDVKIGAANASADELQGLVKWADKHAPVGTTLREAPVNQLRIHVENYEGCASRDTFYPSTPDVTRS